MIIFAFFRSSKLKARQDTIWLMAKIKFSLGQKTRPLCCGFWERRPTTPLSISKLNLCPTFSMDLKTLLDNLHDEVSCSVLACSRRSDSGERCEVKRSGKKIKAREEERWEREGSRTSLPSPPLLFIAFFTSHRSPLSERLEQASSVCMLPFWSM